MAARFSLKEWRACRSDLQKLLNCQENTNTQPSKGIKRELSDTSSTQSSSSDSDHESPYHESFEDIDLSEVYSSGAENITPFISSDESEETTSLHSRLRQWATENHCKQKCVNGILSILRDQGHNLPKDARTLLKTPRIVNTIDRCNGKYVYFGIQHSITSIFEENKDFAAACNCINMKVNVDGVPLFKSKNTHFWPILGSFAKFSPFLIALWCGEGKPSGLKDFLRDFLEEYKNLLTVGLTFNSKTYIFTIKVFICDAPARAYLKCVKGHTGYYSCERCVIEGEPLQRRVIFISGDIVEPRAVDKFNALQYQDHQHSRSPLIDAGINCIKSFPLEYMHLVCLGTVRRILHYLKSGPRDYPCRLSARAVQLVSENLINLNGKMPSDFARQPRPLTELERWKATEFRQFVLYSGPVVLKKVVCDEVYNHFLCLTVALSILLDDNNVTRNLYVRYAKELLEYFVNKAPALYGPVFMSYNIHSLSHLADDVLNHDCSLNELSAFEFENYLQELKKFVRQYKNPIAQVVKRKEELEKCSSQNKPNQVISNFVSANERNGCFLLHNDKYVFVREKRPHGMVCDVVKTKYIKSFFTDPCDSRMINIAYIKDMNRVEYKRKFIVRDDLLCKIVCIRHKRGCVLFPMLHTIERI